MITSIPTKSATSMKFVFAGTVTIKNLTARHAPSVYLNRALIPIGMVLLSACTQMPKVAEKAGTGANASKPVVAAATVARDRKSVV